MKKYLSLLIAISLVPVFYFILFINLIIKNSFNLKIV